MDKKKDNKNFAYLSMLIIPTIFFFIFTLNDTVFGCDSLYFLDTVFKSNILLANTFAVIIWFAIFLSFSFIKNPKQEPLFIGSVFMLNLFNVRLLMTDIDNWLYLITGMIIILYFKNNIKWFDHRIVGFLAIVPYFIYRNFIMVEPTGYTDMIPNLSVFAFFIPTYYILFRKKDWKPLIFIIVSTAIFMTGKFTTNALPLFIYSLYLDLDLDLKHDKIIRYIMVISLIAFIFFAIISIVYPVPCPK